MKRFIEYFITRGLFGDLLTLAIVVLGIWAATMIRREVFPNVNFDVIVLSTIFPGGTAEEVEKLITNPLEQDIKEVDGIKKIQSVSIEGQSRVVLYLDPDQTTESKAKEDLQDVIDKQEDLPEGAEDTILKVAESKLNPIIELTIASNILDDFKLREAAKDLEVELEKVNGVAKIVHKGLRDIDIRVEADQKKLSAYRVSLEEVVNALKKQNTSIPGGVIEALGLSDAKEKIVRTIGDFKKLDDVENTVVRANDAGSAVKVKDVARVFYDLKRASMITRTNGKNSLSLTVLKKEKADAIDVVDRVKKKIDELESSYQGKIEFSFINDMSYYIKRRLNILLGNFTVGIFFVLAMLPFLIPWKFALIVAMGEPFAFLGTILILYLTGNSINLISMIGLIIVSGILVDDSIVVTENAVRLVSEGKKPKEAALEGTLQIMAPVTASVLTTTCAFLPMAFVSGIFGKFIVQIPLAVITSLAVSLLETFIILPAHVAHWIKPQDFSIQKKKNLFTRITDKTQDIWDTKILGIYERWLKFAVHRRYFVLVGIGLFFIFSVFVGVKVMKIVLFPPDGIEIFFVRTEAPVGTSLATHSEMLKPIENLLSQLPKEELDDFTTTVGLVQQDPNDPNTRRGPEFAQVAVFLTPETKRKRKALEIIEDIRTKVGKPEGFVRILYERVNPGPPTGKAISIGVRGENYEEIMPAVTAVKEMISSLDGVQDVTDNFFKGKEEITVKVDPVQAASAGVSVSSVGMTVRAAFEGITATTVKSLKEEIDVVVSLAKDQRANIQSLDNILVPNPQGNLIHLSQISKQERGQSITTFEHEGNERQVRVTGEVDTKKISAIQVADFVRTKLPEISEKFPKVEVFFGGEDEDTKESMASLARAFIFSIVGIFLILVLTFGSLLQPLLTLITIPLGLMSVIWAFFLHGMPLSFMGFLGIIALAGVIVNNAIVFVDFVNQERKQGADRYQSIIDAAKIRARPIFLTTITTVIGIMPTAYGIGGLDKFVVPIAMALGWGLMFGSLLTAFIFPAALAATDDGTDVVAKIKNRLFGGF